MVVETAVVRMFIVVRRKADERIVEKMLYLWQSLWLSAV